MTDVFSQCFNFNNVIVWYGIVVQYSWQMRQAYSVIGMPTVTYPNHFVTKSLATLSTGWKGQGAREVFIPIAILPRFFVKVFQT